MNNTNILYKLPLISGCEVRVLFMRFTHFMAGCQGYFITKDNAMNRSLRYHRHWNKLVELHGGLCFYCQEEIAVSIDHIIPQSWDHDDSIENLVPACMYCNSIASDKMFEDVEIKRQYILKHRRRTRRAICTDCLLPFTYRYHSPSLFMCAICYDIEYETKYSKRARWQRWIDLLIEAGIYPDAHTETRNSAGQWKRDRNYLRQLLVDVYGRRWKAELPPLF